MKLSLSTSHFNVDIYGVIRRIVIVFYTLIIFSGTLALTIGNFLPDIVARLFDELLLVSLIIFLIGVIFITKRLAVSVEIVWVILFGLIGIVTSLINQVQLEIMVLGFFLIMKPLIIFLSFQMLPLNLPMGRKLINDIVTFFIVVIVFAIFYSVLFENGLGLNFFPQEGASDVRLGFQASRSFFVHASHFSSTMTFAIFIFFARLLVGEGNPKMNLLMIGLSLVGVLLTLRLKTLLLLPVGVTLEFLLIRYRSGRVSLQTVIKTAVLFGVSLIFILLASFLLRDILILRLSPDTQSVRTLLLQTAWLINLENWGVGVGLGMFGSSVSVSYHYSEWYYVFGLERLTGATPRNPSFITDQWWAWYLGEIGIIGTAVFLIILFQIIKKLNQIASKTFDTQKGLSSFSFAALSSLIFGVLAGFAGVYLSAPPTGYFAMSLAGLAIALNRGFKVHQNNVPQN